MGLFDFLKRWRSGRSQPSKKGEEPPLHGMVPRQHGVSRKDMRLIIEFRLDISNSMKSAGRLPALVEHRNLLIAELVEAWHQAGGNREDVYVKEVVFAGRRRDLHTFHPAIDLGEMTLALLDQQENLNRGHTALYGAVAGGCKSIVEEGEAQLAEGRTVGAVLYFLTDGENNSGHTTEEEARQSVLEAQAKGVRVEYIFVGKTAADRQAGEMTASSMGVSAGTMSSMDFSLDALNKSRKASVEGIVTGTQPFRSTPRPRSSSDSSSLTNV